MLLSCTLVPHKQLYYSKVPKHCKIIIKSQRHIAANSPPLHSPFCPFLSQNMSYPNLTSPLNLSDHHNRLHPTTNILHFLHSSAPPSSPASFVTIFNFIIFIAFVRCLYCCCSASSPSLFIFKAFSCWLNHWVRSAFHFSFLNSIGYAISFLIVWF